MWRTGVSQHAGSCRGPSGTLWAAFPTRARTGEGRGHPPDLRPSPSFSGAVPVRACSASCDGGGPPPPAHAVTRTRRGQQDRGLLCPGLRAGGRTLRRARISHLAGESQLASWERRGKAATALLAALAALGTGTLLAARLFLWDSVRGARLFEQTQANPMADIAAHFQWLLQHARKFVVFFIDDLDRCAHGYVVEVPGHDPDPRENRGRLCPTPRTAHGGPLTGTPRGGDLPGRRAPHPGSHPPVLRSPAWPSAGPAGPADGLP